MTALPKLSRPAVALVIATAAAFLITAPASAQEADKYAAIAFSAKSGAWGYGTNFDSQDAAQKEALAQCSGDDAKIVVWVLNDWCSLAIGDDKIYGYGYADNPGDARKTALAECRKRTINSRVVVTVSADGQVQK